MAGGNSRFMDGQAHREYATLSQPSARRTYSSPMCLRELLHQGIANAETAGHHISTRVRAMEQLNYVPGFVCGDANAIIADLIQRFVAFTSDRYRDETSLCHVL